MPHAACIPTLACPKQTGLVVSPPCLQPVQLLLYALLVSCRKCIVLMPQFPQVKKTDYVFAVFPKELQPVAN